MKEAGFSVMEGANGLEALKRVEGQHVDVIVTDLNMPVNGWDHLDPAIAIHSTL